MNHTRNFCKPIIKLDEYNSITEAQLRLEQEFPGIQYISEKDSFLYQGLEFDYFLSGFMPGLQPVFSLVSQRHPRLNWLTWSKDWDKFIEREKFLDNRKQ